jgi:signal transduction histidine kinase
MGEFFQQIISILTTPPGNLAYHLVILFSVAGALQAALNHWNSTGFPQGKRMVLGLSLLLVARLALLVGAGIGWQGMFNEHLILPPLDRAVTLFSLMIIIWLWAFPEPVRMADAAAILLGLLVITLLALDMVWWSGQGPNISYNGSWADFIGENLAILLLVIGGLLLLVRRPNGWGMGLAMLIPAFAGHLAYQLLPAPSGDYPGIVRLAQLASYPWLFALPQRFPILSPTAKPAAKPEGGSSQVGIDPQLLQAYLDLGTASEARGICQAITKAVAHTLMAEITLLISPPTSSGEMIIQCVYDLIREEHREGATLPSRLAPVLGTAIRSAQPLRLPASTTSSDLAVLAKALNLDSAGHLLEAPIVSDEGNPLFGLILLSPYSNRGWSNEEHDRLVEIAKPLAHLLQRTRVLADLQEQLEQTRQILQTAQAETEQAWQENKTLLAQPETAHPGKSEEPQVASMAALIAAQEEAQDTILRLQAEIEQLRQEGLPQAKSAPDSAEEQVSLLMETQHLEGELRLALEEIARLKSAISESDQKILSLSGGQASGAAQKEGQNEAAVSIAQELRQPMSSIIGYTDFLLGESVGILGALQRKFLERIKVATERMSRLVDDLNQVTDLNSNTLQLVSKIVDLSAIIDEAIAQTRDQLLQKDIALSVDLPEQLPSLKVDHDAIQQVLVTLLENAGSVTPASAEISLQAHIEKTDQDHRYVLLQIADQGGGIAAEDMPRVFSRLHRAESAHIEGTGDTGISLSTVKTLVEALGGRIWVDSQPGVGAAFSILLPVASTAPSREKSGGVPA